MHGRDKAERTKERVMMVLRPAVILNVGTLAVDSELYINGILRVVYWFRSGDKFKVINACLVCLVVMSGYHLELTCTRITECGSTHPC